MENSVNIEAGDTISVSNVFYSSADKNPNGTFTVAFVEDLSGFKRVVYQLSETVTSNIDYVIPSGVRTSFIIKENETFKSNPVRLAGRYIKLHIGSNGLDDDWEITDLVIQGRFEGER